MKLIEKREDIFILVNFFYAKIRQDDLLGNIFNAHIKKENWSTHIEKITDFWETNLLDIPKFKGNPTAKHLQVDENFDYSIKQDHFGRWLQLWFETIDELYEGEIALKAKNTARKMSTGQFLAIWKNRPKAKRGY